MNTKLFNSNEFSSSDIKNSNITLDDFDHFEGNHQFSEKYTEKKSAFLDSLNDKPKAHLFRYKPYQIAAVFALILIIGSSTTMAASKLYKTHLEKNEYQADIVITPGTKSSTESSAKSSADSETDSSDQTSIETGITGSSSFDYQPLLPSSYYNVGETLPVDLDLNPDCHVTVEQVEYYDSIKDFDRSNFRDDVKLDEKYAATDGTLLSRERSLYSEGDGIHSVPEVIESKKVKQKFVYLTIGVANSSQKDAMDYCADYELAFFNENADGTLTEDTVYYTDASFTEPIYFDASLTNNQDEHFMCTKIPAGQTVTFHIGFLVDEDYTDEMFFFTRGAARSYVLTDIREKK